jgi:ABC-type multidrug transport system fused ATPase/permease subunit
MSLRSLTWPQQVTLRGITLDLSAIGTVLLAYLVTRLMIFLIVFVSSITIPMQQGQFQYAFADNIVLDGLVRYDSWWYHNIATRDYSLGNVETGEQANTPFFPLYPFLVRLVAGITGNVFVAGVLIANVAFLVALSYLYALARREFDTATAGRAVFYLAAAPTAIFFAAMYTESLFVALVIATFSYAGQRQWIAAAIAGALAAATRNTGVLMAGVIALEGLHQQGLRFWPEGGRVARLWGQVRAWPAQAIAAWRSWLAAAFVPLGLLAFMSYLANTLGDPLGFIHGQATFGRDVSDGGGITRVVSHAIDRLNLGSNIWAGQISARALLDVLFTIGFILILVGVARELRPANTIYTAFTLLLPVSSGTVSSMTRYVLMLIPCYLLLARWGRHTWVDRLVLGIFLPLLAYFSFLFSHWYFAG